MIGDSAERLSFIASKASSPAASRTNSIWPFAAVYRFLVIASVHGRLTIIKASGAVASAGFRDRVELAFEHLFHRHLNYNPILEPQEPTHHGTLVGNIRPISAGSVRLL